MQEMESDGPYKLQFDTDQVQMKACEDEAMEYWEDMTAALKQARHKREFLDDTAKKYWKMKAADFVREKRARVLHNNREAKKQETPRANRAGMGTPPPPEAPEEEKVKSRITNLWWLKNEMRALDLRAQAALAALTLGTKNMESVRTHEYALMKGDNVTMIRMQKGMTVSKAGTEALAAAVAVIQCIDTEECWRERIRDAGVEHTGTSSTRRALRERPSYSGGRGGRGGVCGDGSAKRGEKCVGGQNAGHGYTSMAGTGGDGDAHGDPPRRHGCTDGAYCCGPEQDRGQLAPVWRA
jgi:hypothetical protein